MRAKGIAMIMQWLNLSAPCQVFLILSIVLCMFFAPTISKPEA